MDITIAENEICGVAQFKYPNAPETAGTAKSQAELGALMSQIAGGSYTGNVTLDAPGSTPTTFDFGMEEEDAPIANKVVIANNANVKVENLNTSYNGLNQAAMEVNSGATVVLENVNLEATNGNSDLGGRGLQIPNYATDVNLTIKDSKISATGGGYPRGIQVGGVNSTVTVEHSEVYAGHYAINVNGVASGSTVNLTNNTVSAGWAALNIWGSNNTVNATGCTLKGLNDTEYTGWNNFSTITINRDGTYDAINAKVVLDNCTVIAESTTGNKQWAIDVREPSAKVTLKNHTSVTDIDEDSGNHNNPSTPFSIKFTPGDGYTYQAFLSDPDLSEVTSQFVIDATVTETWWNLGAKKGMMKEPK
jgi:hypothetical protein